jgi:hypothetical protein
MPPKRAKSSSAKPSMAERVMRKAMSQLTTEQVLGKQAMEYLQSHAPKSASPTRKKG